MKGSLKFPSLATELHSLVLEVQTSLQFIIPEVQCKAGDVEETTEYECADEEEEKQSIACDIPLIGDEEFMDECCPIT